MSLTPHERIWVAKLSNDQQLGMLALGLRQVHAEHVAGYHREYPETICRLCSLVETNHAVTTK